MPRLWLALTLLALALAVSGCSDDDPEQRAASTPTPTDKERTRTSGKARAPKERAAARREAAEEREQVRELKELEEDREFDRSFEESTFERLVGRLPIRRPPLFVEQYISGEGHKVYTAVDRKRFCRTSADERERAVASFFAAANRSFRRANVNDFEQVVTPLSDTIDKLPALATARRSSVELTRLGRDC